MSLGLEAFAARLRKMASAVEAEAEIALRQAAERAAAEARACAPVDRGTLRAGIRMDGAGRMEARVVSAAPHAAMVEYGTSRTPPRPYMLPAAEAARQEMTKAAQAGLRRAMREGRG